MKQRIAIYGAGALAKQIINYNQRYNMFEVVALIDDYAIKGQSFMGYDVLPFDSFKNAVGGGKYYSFNRLCKVQYL